MLTDRYRYSSPFPRNKKNEEIINMSKSVYFKNKTDKLRVEIPPSLTKSYMSNNNYYFDTKKWKEIHTKPKEEILVNKRINSARVIPSSSGKNIQKLNDAYKSSVVDRKKLEVLLSYNNDDINNIVKKELELTGMKQRDLIKDGNSYQFNKSVSPKKFLNTVIDNKYKPHYHKYYASIPN